MSAYNRSHQRNIDAQSEPDTDDRVAALTEQLVNERADSPRHVAEALDELGGWSDHNDDGNTIFSADLAAALMGGPGAREAYFATLDQKVRTYLARDASTDAEFRVSQQIAEAEEMRAESRMAVAA